MIPRRSLGLFLDKLVRLPLSYLVLIYTSKVYSPRDFGALSLAIAISSILFVITDCGVTQYLIEASSKQDQDKAIDIASAVAIRALANLVLLTLLLVILMTAANRLVIAILVLLTLSNLVMTYPLCLRQGMLDRKEYISIAASDNLSSWALQVFKYLFAFLGLNIAFQAIAQLVASLFQALLLIKRSSILGLNWCALNYNAIISTLNKSKHYLLSSIVVFAYVKADQLILSAFHGLANLASYSLAVMVVESTMIFFPVILSIFSSKICDNSARIAKKTLKILNRYLILTSCALFAVSILFACIGVPLLFGSKYANLNINILFLSPCILITAITSSLILQMQHERMSKKILGANSVAAIVSLTLSVPMIYYGSGVGASIATTLSSATLPIALLLFGGNQNRYNISRLAI
jgi:O-antigen/teichoic acid export membrane protein